MESRVRWKSHARFGSGENLEIISNDYLSTLCTKAPENQLEKTIIADLVYQPLYVTNEVTSALQKNYVRSRTLIHVCRTDGIACIEVKGTEKIIGQ